MLHLKAILAGFGLFFTLLAASWFGGRKSAQTDTKLKEAQDYADTRKRMDEVGRMSDADAAREWLRDRAKRGRDL
jgi:hypothetical protein